MTIHLGWLTHPADDDDPFAPEQRIVARILARGGATATMIATALRQQSVIELFGLGLLLALRQRRLTLPRAADPALPTPEQVLAELLGQTARLASDATSRRAVEELVTRWAAATAAPSGTPPKEIPSPRTPAMGPSRTHHDR